MVTVPATSLVEKLQNTSTSCLRQCLRRYRRRLCSVILSFLSGTSLMPDVRYLGGIGDRILEQLVEDIANFSGSPR